MDYLSLITGTVILPCKVISTLFVAVAFGHTFELYLEIRITFYVSRYENEMYIYDFTSHYFTT